MVNKEPSEAPKPDSSTEKLGMLDKTGKMAHEFFSAPTRTTEAIAAGIMSQLEIVHDRQLFPEKWERLGFPKGDPGTWMVPDNPPALKWAFDNIGDIWEVSVGHGVLRLCMFAINGMLRKPETVGLQKKILQNETVKNMTSKVVGGERASELAEGAEVQISDEACFWTSLATTFTIKAIHSMGWISLFGIHDHMDEPVPGMIFGQAVAATALAASHYTAKNHESIKDLALRVAETTRTSGTELVEHFKNWQTRAAKFGVDVGVRIQEGLESHIKDLNSFGDYIEMEQRVAELMLKEWQSNQEARWEKVLRGNAEDLG